MFEPLKFYCSTDKRQKTYIFLRVKKHIFEKKEKKIAKIYQDLMCDYDGVYSCSYNHDACILHNTFVHSIQIQILVNFSARNCLFI